MSTYDVRPPKRRRIKKNDPLREDDVGALDAVTVERVTVETRKGPVQQKIFVPIPQPSTSMTSDDSIHPDLNPDNSFLNQFPVPSNDDSEFFTEEAAASLSNTRKVSTVLNNT